MASELTVALLRFGFLALLWVFVFVILAAQRRDLGVGQGVRFTALPRRRRGRTRDAAHTAEGTAPAGFRQQMPPAPQLPGQLVIVDGPEAGRVATLGHGPVLLGRAPDCTVTLQDDYCSGHHARLFPQGSRWFLEDLGSTNGTFVGDQHLSRTARLEPGEPFTVGRTVLELRA